MKEHIILLHGALGTKQQLEGLKLLLSEQFEIHTFNFEGHGGVAIEKSFSIDLFVDNTYSYIKTQKLEKAIVFGYSMGGYVALRLASKYQDLVPKILTLGTKFDWTPDFAQQEIRMLNPDKIEEKVPKFAHYLASLHTVDQWKEVVVQTANMMRQLGNAPELGDHDLKNIVSTVVIMVGGKDTMVTQEESKRICDVLPNAHFKVIDEFHHQIEKINKQELAQIILDVIKKMK